MNFGKLLAASKNIFGGGKVVVYRANRHVYLPKFNGEKNPFLPKAATGSERGAEQGAANGAGLEPKPAEAKSAAPKQTVVSPVAAPAAQAAVAVAAVNRTKAAGPAKVTVSQAAPTASLNRMQPSAQPSAQPANWTEKWNPFRSSAPVKSAGHPGVPAVQEELSLDAVKVLHNDLSDADVEVVPVKSRTVAAAAGSPTMAGLFNEQLLTTA
jgi:hypothetical protein